MFKNLKNRTGRSLRRLSEDWENNKPLALALAFVAGMAAMTAVEIITDFAVIPLNAPKQTQVQKPFTFVYQRKNGETVHCTDDLGLNADTLIELAYGEQP